MTLTRGRYSSSPLHRSEQLQPVLALTLGGRLPTKTGGLMPTKTKARTLGSGHVTMWPRAQPTCQSKVASRGSPVLSTDADTSVSLESWADKLSKCAGVNCDWVNYPRGSLLSLRSHSFLTTHPSLFHSLPFFSSSQDPGSVFLWLNLVPLWAGRS